MRIRRGLVTAAAAVALGACGGAPVDEGAGAVTALAPMEGGATGAAEALAFCGAYHSLVAARNAACRGGSVEDWSGRAASGDRIRPIDVVWECGELSRAVAARRVGFDGEHARACLAELATAACRYPLEQQQHAADSPCSLTRRGLDGTCVDRCPDDTYPIPLLAAPLSRFCVARKSVGAACAPGQCVALAFCGVDHACARCPGFGESCGRLHARAGSDIVDSREGW